MNGYSIQYLSDIEAQDGHCINTERNNKKAIATSMFGKPYIKMVGYCQYTPIINENAQLMRTW